MRMKVLYFVHPLLLDRLRDGSVPDRSLSRRKRERFWGDEEKQEKNRVERAGVSTCQVLRTSSNRELRRERASLPHTLQRRERDDVLPYALLKTTVNSLPSLTASSRCLRPPYAQKERNKKCFQFFFFF